MALPTILVNSATGSDTQASGAGPTTALFGTSDASTDGTGTTVTLTAGTDLSGVATDGSHVIFLNDATAGNRNFGKITGSAGSGGATPTVTVSNAFGLNLTTKSWAIGGKRASIASTTSKKLFDNNAGSGDAMPGWAVEMQSGHTETIAATLDLRRSGDTTTGVIILRGESGAATMPVVTFSNNGNGIVCRGVRQIVRDFELRNSNATKTASIAIGSGSNNENIWIGLKITHATNKFWKAMNAGASSNTIVGCEVANTASDGITVTLAGGKHDVLFNYIHDCGGIGIANPLNTGVLFVYGNIIARNTDGLKVSGASVTTYALTILQNTFDANTADAIEMTGADTDGQWLNLVIVNNIFSNNGGYAVNSSGLGSSSIFAPAIIYGNNFYNNTSGFTPQGPVIGEFNTTLDPQYIDAANGNFKIGTNLKAQGYPLGGTLNIGYSLSSSFVDPGAVQRSQEADLGYLPVAP